MMLSPATSHPIGCTIQKLWGLLHCINAPEIQERRLAMKVKDVMHKGVDWVSPDTPLTELAKLMRAHDIGCIPVGEDDTAISSAKGSRATASMPAARRRAM
jgi:predicted transcriptional regulator